MDWEKFLEKCEHYGVKITKNANDGGFFLKQKNGSLEKIDIGTLFEEPEYIHYEGNTVTSQFDCSLEKAKGTLFNASILSTSLDAA